MVSAGAMAATALGMAAQGREREECGGPYRKGSATRSVLRHWYAVANEDTAKCVEVAISRVFARNVWQSSLVGLGVAEMDVLEWRGINKSS